MNVSLFITCLADAVYPSSVGRSTVELLERLGCNVSFPRNQTCCGQPAFNSGYQKETQKVARHMITTFEDAEWVVTPSGSCATMVQEYKKLFSDDEKWQKKAEALASKTYELTQFIVDVLGVENVGAEFHGTVTYHSSCHMTRLLGVKEAPVRLLENVSGLTLTELPFKEHCCGFGGTFAVKMMPISQQMVDEKVQHIEETKAAYLVGSDLGCLMNIGGRIERTGRPVEVRHIAEILNSRKEVHT
jgi:L-lactate dehydrogenase complex protein LldE